MPLILLWNWHVLQLVCQEPMCQYYRLMAGCLVLQVIVIFVVILL